MSTPGFWSSAEIAIFKEFRKLHDNGTPGADIATPMHQTAMYRGWHYPVFDDLILRKRENSPKGIWTGKGWARINFQQTIDSGSCTPASTMLYCPGRQRN